MAHHVSKSEFAALVERALAELPAPFSGALDEVTIEIRDRATRRELQSVGLREKDVLLGLYHGRPRTERSVEDHARFPDVIYIFQGAIETASDGEAALVEQVRKTVLHELGHHFGMDEDQLDELGFG